MNSKHNTEKRSMFEDGKKVVYNKFKNLIFPNLPPASLLSSTNTLGIDICTYTPKELVKIQLGLLIITFTSNI